MSSGAPTETIIDLIIQFRPLCLAVTAHLLFIIVSSRRFKELVTIELFIDFQSSHTNIVVLCINRSVGRC